MWRETMRTPSFFLLDAHCIFVLPRFLFCIRSWTFAVLLATVLSFAAIRMFPYRPASAVREFRSALAVLCASPLATTDCVLWWITALSIALRAKKRFSHWSAFAVCCRCPPCKAPRFCRFFSGCAELAGTKTILRGCFLSDQVPEETAEPATVKLFPCRLVPARRCGSGLRSLA